MGPRSRTWVGMACRLCEYSVLSPDTSEGIRELMMLHMQTAHPGIRWMDAKGRIHGSQPRES